MAGGRFERQILETCSVVASRRGNQFLCLELLHHDVLSSGGESKEVMSYDLSFGLERKVDGSFLMRNTWEVSLQSIALLPSFVSRSCHAGCEYTR